MKIIWCHDMETLSSLITLCVEIAEVSEPFNSMMFGGFPAQRASTMCSCYHNITPIGLCYVEFISNMQDHFVNAPSQWKMTLHCNIAFHWLGAYTKWSMNEYVAGAYIWYIYQQTVSSLVEVMAWYLLSIKPLAGTVLKLFSIEHQEQTKYNFNQNIMIFIDANAFHKSSAKW